MKMTFEEMLKERNYNPQKVVDIKTLTHEEWLECRKNGFGGSDAPIVMEESEWCSPLELYHQKIKSPVLVEVPEDLESKFRLNFGNALEAFVAEIFPYVFEKKYRFVFEMQFGKKIKRVNIYKDTFMYRHPIFDFMQVDLDYVIEFTFTDDTVKKGVFECKTTSPYAITSAWENDVPLNYQLQCRHAMAVMNYDFTVIACASDNAVSHYYAYLFFRDNEKEKMIITAEKNLWENNILKHIPPEITMVATDTYFNTILKYGAGPVGTIQEEKKLTAGKRDLESYFKKLAKISDLKDKIKILEKALKVDVAKIFVQIGENDVAVLETDDCNFHIKKVNKEKTSFDKASLKKAMPELVEELTKVKCETELEITKDVNVKSVAA